jgi:hypothetical protein
VPFPSRPKQKKLPRVDPTAGKFPFVSTANGLPNMGCEYVVPVLALRRSDVASLAVATTEVECLLLKPESTSRQPEVESIPLGPLVARISDTSTTLVLEASSSPSISLDESPFWWRASCCGFVFILICIVTGSVRIHTGIVITALLVHHRDFKFCPCLGQWFNLTL